jgi:hypothetical protein
LRADILEVIFELRAGQQQLENVTGVDGILH